MDVFTDSFWLFLLFLTASFLLPYLASPFLIHRRVKMQADPEIVPFTPDHPSLPADVADHFRTVIPQLEGVGFETVAGLALPRQTTNVQAMVLGFVNRETKDVAVASVMYGERKEGPKLQTAYVEIATRFRDGTVVQTNNTDQLGAFPRAAHVFATQFPTILEADRLFAIHSYLVEKFAGHSSKILRLDEEFHGDARAYLTQGMREEMERQVPAGYLYLSESERVYRPTWKGAFLMTWKLLFPWRHIRLARRDRLARNLLKEWEMHSSGV